MILENANVLTMDARMPHARALVIAGGRIVGGVDSREDAIASQAHERIDLDGATVLPGFTDAHVHFGAVATQQRELDCSECASLEAILTLVAKAAAADTTNACVVGRGVSDTLTHVMEQDDSFAARLSAAAPGGVAITSHDGHSIVCDSATAHAAGVRVGESFAGVLREADAWSVRDSIAADEPSNAEVAAAIREAQKRGITGLHDMDGAAALRMWRAFELERGLPLRVTVHVREADLPHVAALGLGAGFGSDRLQLGGLKVFADGTLGSGTAWLSGVDNAEAQLLSRSRLTELAREAASAHMPLVVHAIGDGAVSAAVAALSDTFSLWDSLPMRPRIEHVQLAQPDDIARCAELGITLSVQPSHLLADRDAASAAWHDRLDHAYAYGDMVRSGAPVIFGSDAPIEALDPREALQGATRRARDDDAPWLPAQAIGVEDALFCMTAAVHDISGTARTVGRLTPGLAADLVVLDGDPRTTPPHQLSVLATMVEGRFVYGRPNLAHT